jgi:hypothetical protein
MGGMIPDHAMNTETPDFARLPASQLLRHRTKTANTKQYPLPKRYSQLSKLPNGRHRKLANAHRLATTFNTAH